MEEKEQKDQNTDEIIDQQVDQLGAQCDPGEKSQLRNIFVDILQYGMSIIEAIGMPAYQMELIYNHALNLYAEKKYHEANLLFYFLHGMNAKDPRYPFAYAASFHKMKKYQEAAGFYMLTTSMQEENPAPWFHMGDCYIQLKQYDVALVMLTKAIALAGENPQHVKLKQQADALRVIIESSVFQKQEQESGSQGG